MLYPARFLREGSSDRVGLQLLRIKHVLNWTLFFAPEDDSAALRVMMVLSDRISIIQGSDPIFSHAVPNRDAGNTQHLSS